MNFRRLIFVMLIVAVVGMSSAFAQDSNRQIIHCLEKGTGTIGDPNNEHPHNWQRAIIKYAEDGSSFSLIGYWIPGRNWFKTKGIEQPVDTPPPPRVYLFATITADVLGDLDSWDIPLMDVTIEYYFKDGLWYAYRVENGCMVVFTYMGLCWRDDMKVDNYPDPDLQPDEQLPLFEIPEGYAEGGRHPVEGVLYSGCFEYQFDPLAGY